MDNTNLLKNKIHSKHVLAEKQRILFKKRENLTYENQQSSCENEMIDFEEKRSLNYDINKMLLSSQYSILENQCGTNDTDIMKSRNDINQKSFSQFSQQFKGINQITGEIVDITVSHSNILSYELIKHQSNVLKVFTNSDSPVLLFKEEIDIPEKLVFILITESYDQSLQDILQQRNFENQSFSFQQLAEFSHQLICCLVQLHCQGILHSHITTSSIVVTKEGQLKMRNFIPLEHFSKYHSNVQEMDNLQEQIFLSFEGRQALNGKYEAKMLTEKSDVFSLGLILLTMMGIQINERVLSLLEENNFQQINKEQKLNPDFNNLFSFISNYMLIPYQSLRYSAYFLQRQLQEDYNDIMLDSSQVVSWYQKQIETYKVNQLKPDLYLVYLQQMIAITEQRREDQEQTDTLNYLESQDPYYSAKNPELYVAIIESYFIQRKYNKLERLILQFLVNEQPANHRIYYILTQTNNGGFFKKSLVNYNSYKKYYSDSLEQNGIYYSSHHLSSFENNLFLGQIFNSMMDGQLARDHIKNALSVAKINYTGVHISFIKCLDGLVIAYKELGDEEKLEKVLLEILELKYRLYPNGHAQINVQLKKLSLYYQWEGKTQECRKYSETLLENLMKDQIKYEYELLKTLCRLGFSLVDGNNLQKALDYFNQALLIVKSQNNPKYPLIYESVLFGIAAVHSKIKYGSEEHLYYAYEHLVYSAQQPTKIHNYYGIFYVLGGLNHNNQLRHYKSILKLFQQSNCVTKTEYYILLTLFRNTLRDFKDEEEKEECYYLLSHTILKLRKLNGKLSDINIIHDGDQHIHMQDIFSNDAEDINQQQNEDESDEEKLNDEYNKDDQGEEQWNNKFEYYERGLNKQI